MTDTDLIPEVVGIAREKIRPNPWNPNELDPDLFNELVTNIEEFGFVQPVIVGPVADETYEYEIIDGEHRFDCLTILDVEEIPCIIKDVDTDMRKFQTVKMNRLRGKFNQKKFSSLVTDLMQRFSFDEVAERLAFTDPTELEGLIERTRDTITDPDMRKEFDKAKDDIQTVDDLSLVLNRLFGKYGDTLPANYMILDFGGKEHLWVRLEKRAYQNIKNQAREVLASGVTFDSFLEQLLTITPIDKFVAKFRDSLVDIPQDDGKDVIDDG